MRLEMRLVGALVWGLAWAAPAGAHQMPEALCFMTVDASPARIDVQLRVGLDAFGYYSDAELDTDGDGEIPPGELALHRTWLERYLQKTLLFLWNGRNHRPALRDVRITPAAPGRPAELVFDLQIEGYDPERPFAVVSRLLAEVADAVTIATVRRAGRTEVIVLTAEAYYTSEAPPPSPFSGGPGPKRRTSSRRGRLVPVENDYVELLYDKRDARLVVYFLGPDRTIARPVDPKKLSLKLKPEAAAEFETVTLTPQPEALDEKGHCYHFVGYPQSLKPLQDFQADLAVRTDSQPVRKVFHVAAEQLLAEAPIYACPNCPAVVSDRAGFRCTRCGHNVVLVQGGRLPYADHVPQHGGQFFAAGDSWHHVEGVLLPSGEFHLYVYDNQRRHIDVGSYTPTGRASRGDRRGADAAELVFDLAADRTHWIAALPGQPAWPVTVSVSLRIPHQKHPASFEFRFVTTTP